MIQFANKNTAPAVRSMWKICFDDTDSFLDFYFTRKYKNENTLLYFEGNTAVASLQMLPYSIRFYGEVVPFYYLAGLCTLPEHRNKGYMALLIKESFKVMQERQIPISILIPAEEWLYGYYQKFNFEKTFEKGDREIDLKSILSNNKNNNLESIFKEFHTKYQQRDFCVLKTQDEFGYILEEYIQDNYPPKYNLSGMSTLIDSQKMLSLYAKNNTKANFSLKVNDPLLKKQTIFLIKNGNVTIAKDSHFDIEVSISMLTRLLFGFQTTQLNDDFRTYFEEHSPIMNLMLE